MYIGSSNTSSHRDIINTIEAIEATSKRGDSRISIKLGNFMTSVKVDRIDIYYALQELGIDIKDLGLDKVPANEEICLRSDICIVMPKLTIEDVYSVSIGNRLLPPRTTHHVTILKNFHIFYPLRKLFNYRGDM